MTILVAHQGYEQNGQLWYNSFDGQSWLGDRQVPNTGMSGSPSLVVGPQGLWCFHQGYGLDGTLWYNSFDGRSWAGDRQVPNTGMSESPSAVLWRGQLWCFHQGYGLDGTLRCNVFDGQAWTGDQVIQYANDSRPWPISKSPSAVVWNDQLYCVVQGLDPSGVPSANMWYISNDGLGFNEPTPVPYGAMEGSPSATVTGLTPGGPGAGRLTIFVKGWAQPDMYGMMTTNSLDWTDLTYQPNNISIAPNTGMSESPCAVASGGEVGCFHQGYAQNGQLWYNIFQYESQSWAGDRQVPGTGMSGSPAAIAF